MATLLLDLRSDVTQLIDTHRDIGLQFLAIREELDFPASNVMLQNEVDLNAIERKRNLSKQFDDLIQRIWELPGFDSFLRGPSDSDLMDLAQNGPLVVFVSVIR